MNVHIQVKLCKLDSVVVAILKNVECVNSSTIMVSGLVKTS